ncbi:MAG: 6-bladed beta-propeller [Candidatus Aminicenantes bacterium]|nr:6-bladed beta-propeller [Candidatus Aminicenantes bacterium]
MKKTLCVLFIFFVFFWSAYSKTQKPESLAKVEVIDGIEFVHNSGTPMYPDKTVTFVEDLSIKIESDDWNILRFTQRLKLVDDDESIYISENKDQVIDVFGSDGKYIRKIGAKGDGPGEFQSIIYLAVTEDGQLMVIDSRAKRTSFFDSSGKFLKSFQWQNSYSRFHLMKNSSYVTSEVVRGSDPQFMWLYVKEIDFGGEEIRSYGEFTLEKPLIVRQGNASNFMSFPVSPSSLFSGDQEREIFYHCLNNKYLIEVYDTSGKVYRKIDRPYEPIQFTDKDKEEYWARYEGGILEWVRKEVEAKHMPKVKNIVSKMSVDDESNLWIRTYENKKEEGKILTAYDIFNPDGHYYARVWTEFTSFIFKKGKMYRMDIDQNTGSHSMKRYKVVWE